MLTTFRKISVLVIVWVIAVSLIGYVIWRDRNAKPEYIVPTFDESLPPILPPILDTKGTEDLSEIIRVETPKTAGKVLSPLIVTGVARGEWYFEASFPIRLEDGNGQVLVEHFAEAQGEWMTEEFVPFKAELVFNATPTSQTGTLILMKDNPSGDTANDDEIRVLVRFE